MPPQTIKLTDALARFTDHWRPRIVSEVNGHQIKLAKLLGEFVWHQHADEDEMFLVVHGRLRLEFRDGVVELGPGEMITVPRGVEHRPVAEDEVHVLLVEPGTTVNTGDPDHDRTVDAEWMT